MKKMTKIYYLALSIAVLAFASCSGKSTGVEETIKDTQAALIAKTFEVGAGSIKQDGNTPAGDWSKFNLTFTGGGEGGSYTTTGSGSANVWPASGTWKFSDESAKQITRSDGVVMNLTAGVSGVTLDFSILEESSRTVGKWVFELKIGS